MSIGTFVFLHTGIVRYAKNVGNSKFAIVCWPYWFTPNTIGNRKCFDNILTMETVESCANREAFWSIWQWKHSAFFVKSDHVTRFGRNVSIRFDFGIIWDRAFWYCHLLNFRNYYNFFFYHPKSFRSTIIIIFIAADLYCWSRCPVFGAQSTGFRSNLKQCRVYSECSQPYLIPYTATALSFCHTYIMLSYYVSVIIFIRWSNIVNVFCV